MKRILDRSRRLPTSVHARRFRNESLPLMNAKIQKRFKTDEIPPLLLYATASPEVFISSAAIDQSSNEIHPKSLFAEQKRPPSFQSSQFKYISPVEFNFELPGRETPVPEVAFLGRSNVGKSSLLNSLTTKDLAKTSKTPGRTQQVNYFGLYPPQPRSRSQQDGDLPPLGYIVDLPGYGYAKAPDEVVAKWQKNTQDFLQHRIEEGNLIRIYVLIDARRGMDVFDSSILGWLDEAECDYTVVLTKADAVGKAKIVKAANQICMRYHAQSLGAGDGCQGPFVHVTSSKRNKGIVDLMWAVDTDFAVGGENLRSLNRMSSSQDVSNSSSHGRGNGWGDI